MAMLNIETKPVLIGERIQLRLMDESDWPLFKEINTNPRLMAHIRDIQPEEQLEEMFRQRVCPSWNPESPDWLPLSIIEQATKKPLGSIALRIRDHHTRIGEVGFVLTEQAQGKGFAREALQLLIDYGFNELGLNKLMAICSVNNAGSYQLLEKAGFIREGRLAQNALIAGQYIDDYVYGLCTSNHS